MSNSMLAMNKMQWMVDLYESSKLPFTIHETKQRYGTIVMPTGAGKSGKIFEDMIWHIENAKENEKIIFHLSAPILKLERQTINDVLEGVFKHIFKPYCDDGKFMFFYNSSDDGNEYETKGIQADVNPFSNISLFKKSKKAQFAIVASCHKSLVKFADKLQHLKEYAKIITYIDEAHTVVCHSRDEKPYDKLNAIEKTQFDAVTELCKGDYLYALTATPDKYLSMEINKRCGLGNNPNPIINVHAQDLINKNIILPIECYYQDVVCDVANDDENDSKSKESVVTSELCNWWMKQLKQLDPYIKHKVLVTCSTSDHLRKLENELCEQGYQVFSTCAKYKCNSGKDEEFNGIDESEFIETVDSYDDDCFVLHIRQLREGIDIKTLTDCIHYNSTRLNDGVKKILIQTIGRIVRPKIGERGMSKDQRTKKCGRVLFVTKDKDAIRVKEQTVTAVVDYYGVKGIKIFTDDHTKHGGQFGTTKKLAANNPFEDGQFSWVNENPFPLIIEEMVINMEEYFVTKVKPKHDLIMEFGLDDYDEVTQTLKDKFFKNGTTFKISQLITETEFMEYVSNIFNKYHVFTERL